MGILSRLRVLVVNQMIGQLNNHMIAARNALIGYSVVMSVFSIVCVMLGACYAKGVRNVTSKIAKYAHDMASKSVELANEKRRFVLVTY